MPLPAGCTVEVALFVLTSFLLHTATSLLLSVFLERESNVNNGYSSVLYDPDDSTGLGVYRAFYSAGDPAFVAPDCPPNECGSGTATLMVRLVHTAVILAKDSKD